MTQLAHDAPRLSHKPLRLLAPHGGRPRLLLAEDYDPVRIVTAATLKAMGCEVEAVIHGEHAVKLACEKSFDVIVLDIEMPVMDGITAARSIRRLGCASATPLMALSAFLADSMRGGYWRDTFDIALPKPANRNELHEAVTEALAWSAGHAGQAAVCPVPILDSGQLAQLRGGITETIWRQLAESACRDIEVCVNQLENSRPDGRDGSDPIYVAKLASLASTFAATRMAAAAEDYLDATADAARSDRLRQFLAAARATVAALRA